MKSCLITFQSQTQAVRLKSVAKKEQIGISMVQTPKEISYGGCSYALRCDRRDIPKVLSLCKAYRVSYSRIFSELTDVSGRRYYEEIAK
ncbi:MAG: DUF3343 domain-containing protein [Clostridia bacterium]|nr:DUF3343 domain-containing protein [Clostridia bacterium]